MWSRRLGIGLGLTLVGWTSPGLAFDPAAAWSRADSVRQEAGPAAAVAWTDSLRARHAEDAPAFAQASFVRANMLMRTERYADAEAAYAEVASLAAAVPDTGTWAHALLRQAQSADAQGRPPRSVALYERGIELATAARIRALEASGAMYLARRDMRAGELPRAGDRLVRAVDGFLAAGDTLNALNARYLKGLWHQRSGDPDAARDAWESVLTDARARGIGGLAANCLTNLGTLAARTGRPDVASARYEEASELLEVHGHRRSALVPAMNAARSYLELGRREDARRLFTRQLALARELGFPDHAAFALGQLGDLAREEGRPAEARAKLREAFALLEGSQDPDTEIRLLRLFARAMVEADSAAAALEVLDRRRRQLPDQLDRDKAVSLRQTRSRLLLELERYEEALALATSLRDDTGDPDQVLTRLGVLQMEAEALRGLGRTASARATLDEAVELFERVRALPDDPEWREARGAVAARLFGSLAELLLASPVDAPQSDRALAAFSYLQRFRSRTLQERLMATHDPDRAPLPVTAAVLQGEVLAPGEVLLDYHVLADATFLFVVRRDALALVRLPGLDSPQRHQAERLAELLGQPEVVGLGPGEARIEAIRAGSAAVAEAFLAPAVPHLTDAERVVVVGDRFLHKLPFRLLWEAVGAPPVELGRVPSASILARLREGGDGASSASVFAYASGSPDLPQATREVRDLAGTYEGVGVFDPEARRLTPDAWSQHRVVHLAGHIVVDSQRPWRSGIALGDPEPMLRAEEIERSPLVADLVVLSGCESAAGRVLSGEGMLGLPTAFLAAGARCVVASLWPVDDAATREFAQRFYAALAEGGSVAAALATAQDRLRREGSGDPFHWGAFTAIGASELTVPLTPRAAGFGSRWWIAIGLALVLAWVARRYSRARNAD